MSRQQPAPLVMAFSGHDPSGGAGIQADIEAVASQGARAATVVTALTAQDSAQVYAVQPVAAAHITAQAQAVLNERPVSAFKVGLLPEARAVHAVAAIIAQYPGIPVVVDPVAAAGGGRALASPESIDAVREALVPLTTVLTPNHAEATVLVPERTTTAERAAALLDRGCRYVLVTGADTARENVVNTLYGGPGGEQVFDWPLLPGRYHGSGCTLAAAIAGQLATGVEPFAAMAAAQRYAWESLRHGIPTSAGHGLPDRLWWATNSNDE